MRKYRKSDTDLDTDPTDLNVDEARARTATLQALDPALAVELRQEIDRSR